MIVMIRLIVMLRQSHKKFETSLFTNLQRFVASTSERCLKKLQKSRGHGHFTTFNGTKNHIFCKTHFYAIAIIAMLFLMSLMSVKCGTKRLPNVVFILVDDLGWKDLGCYGSSFYETPKLDAFAQESVRFTQAYAASPVCSPTRAAIMSGQHPIRVGITDWIPGNDPENRQLQALQDRTELALDEYTLAEAFRDNGYHTFFAGKWHLGDEGYFPEDQGFAINKGGHHRGSPPGGYYVPYDNPKLTDGPEGEYLPDRLTSESLAFIDENRNEPFLLFLSFYTVHTPIQASKRHLAKYEAKQATLPNDGKMKFAPEGDGQTLLEQVRPDYASMMEAMDENVGRLLQKLKDEGLWENTIIIFTSDNGGLTTLPENRTPPTAVPPLRAGKGWCYEGGIRVPLLVRVPGINQGGMVSEVPVISHDFYPTLVNALELNVKQDVDFDGVDISPALRQKSLQRETLFWHYPHYHGSTWTPGAAIRQGDWKLVVRYENKHSELYNLAEDVGEQNDLSADFPAKKRELEKLLLEKQRAMGASLPERNLGFGK